MSDQVKRSAVAQGREIPAGWKPTASEPLPVARCRAIKSNGERCGRWGIRGTTLVIENENGETITGGLCPKHGGRLKNVADHAAALNEAARLRLIGSADDMLDVMFDLAQNSGNDGVRQRAAADLLDRAGVKGAIEIDVQVTQAASPIDRVNERLASMARRIHGDEEAVVVVPEDPDEIVVEEDEETP
jgi:hypothetical protein